MWPISQLARAHMQEPMLPTCELVAAICSSIERSHTKPCSPSSGGSLVQVWFLSSCLFRFGSGSAISNVVHCCRADSQPSQGLFVIGGSPPMGAMAQRWLTGHGSPGDLCCSR